MKKVNPVILFFVIWFSVAVFLITNELFAKYL